ncbi:MAG TPA: EF-hand domain-containing protein [Gammaproteobacteria bacterium]|nr:EF-hand domain-containing protein [Gammaproteobacteria bacterium]
MPKQKPSEEDLDELRETFDYNDRDGDGLIELDEFAAMLDELEANMSETETRVGFNVIDTNGDHRIDFAEFVAWWTDN